MLSCRSILSLALLMCVSACSNPALMDKWFADNQDTQTKIERTNQPSPSRSVQPAPAPQPAPKPLAVPLSNGKTKVAILLPLSGKNAALGQSLLNAAQMAVFDLADDQFELMPRDTGATPESASVAARDALGSGAELIIGPLFANDVTAVKPIAQEHGVNMMALSSDSSLAQNNVFVMGFSPASFVERVVSYAAQQRHGSFAGLFPQTPYGQLMQKSFVESVHRHHGLLSGMETYKDASEIAKAVKALADHKERIDALFIPVGGAELHSILSALASTGMASDRLVLLGTGLWDDPQISKITALQGGWFALADPSSRATFIQSYKEAYNKEPQRLATLAYDATALAALLARNGLPYTNIALTSSNGFAGLDGLFRLTPEGLTERGLAIGEITSQGIAIRETAPTTFAVP